MKRQDIHDFHLKLLISPSIVFCYYPVLVSLVVCFGVASCKSPALHTIRNTKFSESSDRVVISGILHIRETINYDQEVIILPGAMITTEPGVIINFRKKVDILGESEVFAHGVELHFQPGTLTEINVAWFGAKGYDNEDDTDAFRAALKIAREYFNVITVRIPIGRFFVDETLEVRSNPDHLKGINLVGAGNSTSGIRGTNLSWRGQGGSTMLVYSSINSFHIEGIDFTAEAGSRLKHNIVFRPFLYQGFIRNCSFSGVTGIHSANVGLNEGNGDQVSEIHFLNCSFAGFNDGSGEKSNSAISGGLANTKNFYIEHCMFHAYNSTAIDIRISDVLTIMGCTFANNEIDISCGLGGTYASSNYSEASRCFFSGGVSSNIAFTTLINNVFVGKPRDGYVIRDGSGRLTMINNVFGGTGAGNDQNRVKWAENEFSSIFSQGNFYKNADAVNYPFCDRSGRINRKNVTSIHDMGGQNSDLRKHLE